MHLSLNSDVLLKSSYFHLDKVCNKHVSSVGMEVRTVVSFGGILTGRGYEGASCIAVNIGYLSLGGR